MAVKLLTAEAVPIHFGGFQVIKHGAGEIVARMITTAVATLVALEGVILAVAALMVAGKK